jgi:DNA-directed RNA polymerase sigma subunit (sigma70/sigma32)
LERIALAATLLNSLPEKEAALLGLRFGMNQPEDEPQTLDTS